MVDFYASQPAYVAHMAPLHAALGGTFYGPPRVQTEARHFAITVRSGRPSPRERGLCIVASGPDSQKVGRRPTVMVEHGAGQAYDVDHASYSGGSGRDNVVLFLCPNQVVAARNAARYPNAAVAIVGSPRVEALRAAAHPNPPGVRGVVALSFHWDALIALESRWAFPHYEKALPEIAERFDVIGHGHPRFAGFFRQLWERLGVEYVPRFEDVCDRASLYVCDNSSTLYEFAALARPVVVLNAPWYRRDVDLWPRFWRYADVGVQVDEPAQLGDTIAWALSDATVGSEGRRSAVRAIWGDITGPTERAADAVRRVLMEVAA